MSEHPLSERLADLRQAQGGGVPARGRSARSSASTTGARCSPASASSTCSTTARSTSWTCWPVTGTPTRTEERPYTDGVITGWGTVDGRKVFVFSQDFTLFGGALGEVFAEKIHKLMDLALKVGAPSSASTTAPAPASRRAPVSLASYGGIFYRNVMASGVTPQISVIMGPCAGGAVYSPAMTDFIFMVDQTSLHVHHRSRRGEDGDRRGGHASRSSAAR